MATSEHKALANFLKNVHSSLRESSYNLGTEKAWTLHCKNTEILKQYADTMQKIATIYWDKNVENNPNKIISRIRWAAEFCYEYFIDGKIGIYRDKEIRIAKKIDLNIDIEECFQKPYKLIDVGSCYNPFKSFSFLDVFAIDLCPANSSVLQCDFLNIAIGCNLITDQNIVLEIKENYFDIVTFCFVLEYIPSSELRIEACKRAYQILKHGGLMIIVTPDSKHVGANSKIMKCWRYTLACMGFNRIKYEKQQHMHCMAFRKAASIETARRWAFLYKEVYMEESLNIPQDFQKKDNVPNTLSSANNEDDFKHMPFFEIIELE